MCLAVPGQVVRVDNRDDTLMAEVDFGGVRKDVCCEYIPDVASGDYVIVHVGFAIQRLDEESALKTLAEFEQMGILEEEFGDQFALAARQAGLDDPENGGTAR
ncbi:HypC/HybG/HupF family hydrogenase formation chaperone [soil metagenome]